MGEELAWIELGLLYENPLWVYDIRLLNTEVQLVWEFQGSVEKPKLMIGLLAGEFSAIIARNCRTPRMSSNILTML